MKKLYTTTITDETC